MCPILNFDLRVYMSANVFQGYFEPLSTMGIQFFQLLGSGVYGAFGARIADAVAGPPGLVDAGMRLFLDVTPVMRDRFGQRVFGSILSAGEARSSVVLRRLAADPRLAPTDVPTPRSLWRITAGLMRIGLPRAALQVLRRPLPMRARFESEMEAIARLELPRQADASELLDAFERLLLQATPHLLPRLVGLMAPAMLNQLDIDGPDDGPPHEPVLLRVVDEPWPFPPNYPLAPQPLAALDLLDYPEPAARRIGREVLAALAETKPLALARRSAKARALTGPLLGKLLQRTNGRAPRPVVDGDPRTDTRAAAAHVVGVLWASASQAVSVKELRTAIGLSRERLEAAYEFLLEQPPLGLAVQRHGEEFLLVTAPEVGKSIERHRGNAREVGLSRAALEVLAIVAYRQPIARAGIEVIRGSASDSAPETLLERALIERNAHQLFVTTRAFMNLMGLRDLSDLPPLEEVQTTSDNASLWITSRKLPNG
jgi:segregation and condensation protein B